MIAFHAPAPRLIWRLCALCLGLLGVAGATASEAPPPPTSALSGLVRKLADKRAAEKAPTALPTKEELLRPEFRFRRAATWLQLPELARNLSTNEAERAAIMELLVQGVTEASRLLAAQGADNDVAAATALNITQLWSFVRQQEIPEPGEDQVHAQIVSVLAGPEMAKLSNEEKQRFWEYCLGFPIFVLGMREVATEPAAQADLRTIAAAGFKLLVGVDPEHMDIGRNGLELSASAKAILAQPEAATPTTIIRAPQPTTVIRAPQPATPAPSAQPRDPTAAPTGVSGITYAAPAGWAREDTNWATVFRARLADVNDQGQPYPTNTASHAGAIFILPRRAMTGDAHATFDAIWKEQLDGFERGETIVHYRGRLKSGLVIHYMGRFFQRKVRAPDALQTYAVLYLVDLGAGHVQPITAVVEPFDPATGMAQYKESGALRALSFPLSALLDSIQPTAGNAPYPRGGYFAAHQLQGDWTRSTSGYGGSFVNTVTGANAGIAYNAASAALRLGTDGTYNYSFAGYANSPAAGNWVGQSKHEGRYRLDGDVVITEPRNPPPTPFTCCAVGIGTRQTPAGPKRILVTVGARQGGFVGPPLVPNWDSYSGVMDWWDEK